ncbi:MAG TPA: AAA family ATPase [Ruminiclostridium sp.]
MIVCINQQKGGTAKTTTVRELGYLAALDDRKVLMIDMDPQFSLSKSFGLTKDQVKGKSIYDVFMEALDPQDVIIQTKFKNLYLLPASKDLSMLDVDLAIKYIDIVKKKGASELVNVLRRVLEPIRDSFDLILIDTLPSLGMTALNALCVSDWILIPCVPEEACLEQLDDLLEVCRKVKIKLNTSLKYIGILPVMVNRVITHHKQGLKALQDIYSNEYGIKILDAQINNCTVFKDSVALKEPASALYYEMPVLEYQKVYKEMKEIIGL